MKLLLGLVFCITSQAQFLPFPGAAVNAHGAVSSYIGPGNIVSGALFWGGLRAYSAATAGSRAANVCNAADANCVDVQTLASGDFDLATAMAAPLSCTDDACTIKILYDQSGQTNCGASCDFSQATIAKRPTLKFNCFGGKPCLHYAGAQELQSPYGVVNQAQPWTYSAVGERTSGTAYGSILDGSNTWIKFGNHATQVDMEGGVVLASYVSAEGAPHAFLFIGNGSSSVNISDGTSTAGNAGTNGWSPILGVGDSPYGGAALIGYISEVGGWGIAFSGPQQSSMNTNLRTYYGF